MDDSLRQRARLARAEIGAGTLRGEALLQRLLGVPYLERDAFADELLGLGDPPPDIEALPPGAVPYLPCGVDEILAVVREVPLQAQDRFVDLGSGLGRAVMLAHLLTGARAHGIELQGPLVGRARACAGELGLPEARVSFVEADAAEAWLEGTVFFLYAPFNGALLARVLARLEAAAARAPMVVCAVGFELREVRWLRRRGGAEGGARAGALTIYDSG